MIDLSTIRTDVRRMSAADLKKLRQAEEEEEHRRYDLYKEDGTLNPNVGCIWNAVND
jgi:hypothetical protein